MRSGVQVSPLLPLKSNPAPDNKKDCYTAEEGLECAEANRRRMLGQLAEELGADEAATVDEPGLEAAETILRQVFEADED